MFVTILDEYNEEQKETPKTSNLLELINAAKQKVYIIHVRQIFFRGGGGGGVKFCHPIFNGKFF
jgi:hypothetical protein